MAEDPVAQVGGVVEAAGTVVEAVDADVVQQAARPHQFAVQPRPNAVQQPFGDLPHDLAVGPDQAVEQALRRARSTTGPVTIANIAADAGVSTDFIYKHPPLRPQVESLRRSRTGTVPALDRPADSDAAESTLIRRLTQQLAQIRKEHREQITELRTALETAHGELLVLRRQLADGR